MKLAQYFDTLKFCGFAVGLRFDMDLCGCALQLSADFWPTVTSSLENHKCRLSVCLPGLSSVCDACIVAKLTVRRRVGDSTVLNSAMTSF